MARNGGAPRRYGLLGFPFSRIPLQDSSYSSLDNVTWSTACALDRRGDEVVVGAWECTAAFERNLATLLNRRQRLRTRLSLRPFRRR
jgi:hypothetical protein